MAPIRPGCRGLAPTFSTQHDWHLLPCAEMPGMCQFRRRAVVAVSGRKVLTSSYRSDILASASYRQLLPAFIHSPRSGAIKGGPIFLLAVVRGPRRCKELVASWVIWRLAPPLRWYVTLVIAAAMAAAGSAASMTSWRLHDALLFGLLAAFGGITVELTRRTAEPAGLIKDVH